MSKHTPSSRKRRSSHAPLLFCAALGAVALGIIIEHDPTLLAWHRAWPRLVAPMGQMLLGLGAGLATGLVIETMGWAPFLARLARPVTRWGNLPDACGAAFATCFVSAAAANAMLMEAHKAGHISERQLRHGYLLNSGLPVFLLHLPTTFFIVAPLAREAGVIYLALNGLAALLRTALVLLVTRTRVEVQNMDEAGRGSARRAPVHMMTRPPLRAALRTVGERFRRRIGRMALFTAPTYLLMYALHQAGIFDALRDVAARWLGHGLLPVEAAGVLVFSAAAEFSSGVAAAAALLDAGTLGVRETVLALVLGAIVATPIRAIRHQLPGHTGIFTPRLGLVLLLQSQLFRVGSVVVVTALWWWGSADAGNMTLP